MFAVPFTSFGRRGFPRQAEISTGSIGMGMPAWNVRSAGIWELRVYPAVWAKQMGRCDEIWASSRFADPKASKVLRDPIPYALCGWTRLVSQHVPNVVEWLEGLRRITHSPPSSAGSSGASSR
jgi:hypothetical protein